MGSNDEYQEIYYQLCNGQSLLIPVWVIKRNVNDRSVTKVADLLGRIHVAESLQCRPRDLSIYAKGTRIADYQNGQALEIDLPLGDPKIQGTSKDEPLLVVVSTSPLAIGVANVASVQQVESNIPVDGLNRVIDYIDSQAHEAKTLPISQPGTHNYQAILHALDIKLSAPEWQKKPKELVERDPYQWHDSKEDSQKHRKGYMAYLEQIQFPEGVKLFDCSGDAQFLSTMLPVVDRKLKGNIDVAVGRHMDQDISTVRQNMLLGIELKKGGGNNGNSHAIQRQVVMQHLAASYLNREAGILTLMTDLNARWIFFWFKAESKASRAPKDLMRLEATRSEAVYLIQHFLDRSDNGNVYVPDSFLDRASWDQLFEPLQDTLEEEMYGLDPNGNDEGGTDSQGGGGGKSVGKSTLKRDSDDMNSGGSEADMPAKHNDRGSKQTSRTSASKQFRADLLGLHFLDNNELQEEVFRMVLQNPHNRSLLPEMDETGCDRLPNEITF